MSERRGAQGVLAALVVVAGLLLMHGLSSHGTTAPSHEGHHAAMAHGVGLPVVAPPGPDHGGHAMASCVTVLGALLLLLLAAARHSVVDARRRVPGGLRSPARRARAPDPPDLHLLSVCRC